MHGNNTSNLYFIILWEVSVLFRNKRVRNEQNIKEEKKELYVWSRNFLWFWFFHLLNCHFLNYPFVESFLIRLIVLSFSFSLLAYHTYACGFYILFNFGFSFFYVFLNNKGLIFILENVHLFLKVQKFQDKNVFLSEFWIKISYYFLGKN